MVATLLDSAKAENWTLSGGEQLAKAEFVATAANDITAVDAARSQALLEQAVADATAAGVAADVALPLVLAAANTSYARNVLDAIKSTVGDDMAQYRQSTIFRAVHVEAEYEIALSIVLEVFAEVAENAPGVDLATRAHSALVCSHQALNEIAELLSLGQFREPQELLPSTALDGLSTLTALNRQLLAGQDMIGESTAKIANTLGI